jgi:hypothetical protein
MDANAQQIYICSDFWPFCAHNSRAGISAVKELAEPIVRQATEASGDAAMSRKPLFPRTARQKKMNTLCLWQNLLRSTRQPCFDDDGWCGAEDISTVLQKGAALPCADWLHRQLPPARLKIASAREATGHTLKSLFRRLNMAGARPYMLLDKSIHIQ